jgi:hypothetical protein
MFKGFYNNIKIRYFLFTITFLVIRNVLGETNGGLILSGIDTLIDGPWYCSFDFVLQRPCTSSTDVTCNSHFGFLWDGGYGGYLARLTGQGRMLDRGKLNLDSVKSAPADSVMQRDLGLGQPYIFFKIAPDSLSKCIGNVYVLKTGIDLRPVWNRPFYAKIKILKFIVVDSVQHQIKMVFLWAYNNTGTHDLTTSGLDTFHLDPTIAARNSFGPAPLAQGINNAVFKVVGDRFVLPPGLAGKNLALFVYDLSGKKLGQIAVNNEKAINLRQFIKNRGVVVVKVER